MTATTAAVKPCLQVLDGLPMASSVLLAKDFGVRHARVLRLVTHATRLVAGSAEERAFRPGSFIDPRGRTRPMAYLSRDGFGYVLTGLEGPRARECAAAYFRAFDRAGSELAEARMQANDGRALRTAAAQVHTAACAVLLRKLQIEWQVGRTPDSGGALAPLVRH